MSSATQQRMKRVVIDHFGGPEVLKVVEDDIPQPGPGEVRVRVKGFKTTVRLETRHSRA